MKRRMKIALILLALAGTLGASAQNAEDLKFSSANPCVLRVSSKGHVTGNPSTRELRRDFRQYAVYQVDCVWNGKESAEINVEIIPMISGGKDTVPRYTITNSLSVNPGRTSSTKFYCPKNSPQGFYIPRIEKARRVRGVVVRLLRDGRIFKVFCTNGAWQRNAWEPLYPGFVQDNEDNPFDRFFRNNDLPAEKPELAEQKKEPLTPPAAEKTVDKTADKTAQKPPAAPAEPPAEQTGPAQTGEPKAAPAPADKFDIPVPPEVAAKIRERAKKLYPDDFERQADEVSRQTKAWKRLQLEEDKLFLRDFM